MTTDELLRTLEGIRDANYREWDDGLNTADDFVRWAKSRARYALMEYERHQREPAVADECYARAIAEARSGLGHSMWAIKNTLDWIESRAKELSGGGK